MRSESAERILRALMRLMGGLAMLAIFAVVMPKAWIVRMAEASGVGPYPDGVLIDYMTRSVSAIYAMLGMLTWRLAGDVRRYRELIVFVGWQTAALGVLLTAIDFALGMPAAWSWGEGPPTVLTGGAFVWLARRVRRD